MKFSKANYSKMEKVKMFLKKYGYILGIVFAALVITTVGLVAGLTKKPTGGKNCKSTITGCRSTKSRLAFTC